MEGEAGRPSIRLRYAGLILFISRVYSLLVGLLFIIIATRRLTVGEFGLWNYISTILGYWILPLDFIGYWIVRFTARGEHTGATAIFISLTMSTAIPMLFLLSSPTIFRSLNVDYLVLILVAVKLAIIGISSPFDWIAQGLKPEIIAYASIVFETSKLLSASILVAGLRLGLIGIISAISIGYVSKATILYRAVKGFTLGSSRDIKLIRRIFRGIWIPIYGSIPSILSSIDAILLVHMTGTVDSLALISAIRTIGSPIALSLAISAALYPKLLAEGRLEDAEEAMKLVYMLSIPSSIGVILLAPYILSILRSEYTIVSIPLSVYAILQLISIASHLAMTIASGLEKVDLEEEAGFKDYVRSKLFRIANMSVASSLIYVGMLACMLYLQKDSSTSNINPSLSVTYMWIVSVTISTIFSAVYAYKRLLKGIERIKTPWTSIARYTAASIVMAIPVYILKPEAIYIEVLPLLRSITPPILSGVAVYFATLYLIDSWFRRLISRLTSIIIRRSSKF
ncbi:MAG: hypothetical protein RMJ00_01930 [Nitrososphaerota archaeon]|nr:hypothetical protein [Nitrososphaerota archaeon]